MSGLIQRMRADLDARRKQSLLRELRVREADDAVEDLSNNDYLRLARDPRMIAAAHEATERWGTSASASPLISGYTRAHADLNDVLLEATGMPACMLWNTGYAANQAILANLPAKGDLVIADRLIHHSMISGILRSGARLQRYPHLGLERLREILRKNGSAYRDVFVVTESVFSMDGDYPDLAAMAELKQRHGFFWIVDEAHALGWYGKQGLGLLEESGCLATVDVMVGTFGKALGSAGAFSLFASKEIRDWLVNYAGEFIYSTYLTPACAAVALKGLELSAAFSGERPLWRARACSFRTSINVPAGDSPIVPVPVSSPAGVMERAAHLLQQGWMVGAVRPPTVPADHARLRLSLHRQLDEAAYGRLTGALLQP